MNVSNVSFPSSTFYPDYDTYEVRWDLTIDWFLFPFIAAILWYIYLLFCIITSKNKIFNSPYFQIFIVTGIADVINAIVIEYIRFHQRVGLGPRIGWLLQIAGAFTGFTFATHLLGNGLMSFSQFTGVWYIGAHHKIWRKRNVIFIKLFIVLVPLAVYFYLFFIPFVFVKKDGIYVSIKREDQIKMIRALDAVMMILQSILSLIFVLLAVKGIRIKKTSKGALHEVGLITVEIVNCIFGSLQVYYAMAYLLDLYEQGGITAFVMDNFPKYSFIMIIVNGISLPAFSKVTRKEIIPKAWKKTTQSRVIRITQQAAQYTRTQIHM